MVRYDVVEPYHLLIENSPHKEEIDKLYDDVSDIPNEVLYDRITSILAFEHILNLPEVIRISASHLKKGGFLSIAIPNEGRFLWHFAYTNTTGREFRRRYGLDYEVIMKYEHVNTADEIEELLRFYFEKVEEKLFGMNKDIAFYRYYLCRYPRNLQIREKGANN